MSLAVVMANRQRAVVPDDRFQALRAAYGDVVVDVGTGDGRFAYHLARSTAESLVVGVDPVAANMAATARRAARKQAKGGAPNLLLVHASVEELPTVLHRTASAVFVQLPWGRLLEGIVTADPEIVGGLARLCAPGAHLTLTLNTRIWEHDLPGRFDHLPAPTPAHVAQVVAPAFAAKGIELRQSRYLTYPEMRSLGTTWAKRLSSGCNEPLFLHVAGCYRGPS
ncbi:MAG: methyltransferase domain-containing protein [Actinomycetota bacterium]|nr:methyltransferase domain-containing protein [Actinomycetota bacterium]